MSADHIPSKTKLDEAWSKFLRDTASNRGTWECFTGGYAAGLRDAHETVASPVHQLCLAYEQGFGQGGRLVINPYPPGSDGFEAWEIGRHEWTMRQRGALKAFAGRSGIQGPGDEDQNSRLAPSAAVHLCAPHGKDWLTCPECAKAAGIGPASQ